MARGSEAVPKKRRNSGDETVHLESARTLTLEADTSCKGSENSGRLLLQLPGLEAVVQYVILDTGHVANQLVTLPLGESSLSVQVPHLNLQQSCHPLITPNLPKPSN